ncbi:reverse transcriptase domain-containing protein [Tanacetum coccineum]
MLLNFLIFFEINELKAQLQDKNIAISELKKLIENMKGKSVDTNFGKPSILGKPPLQTMINQPVVRQSTAFKSERSSFSKPWFASQVVEKKSLTKPVTPHSWPKVRELIFARAHHVNAHGPSRNSSKTVSKTSPREYIRSNDMVHNHYLEEAKKGTNSETPSFKFQTQGVKICKITKHWKAKQWMKRLPTGPITTWILFKSAFLDEYHPPSKIIEQTEAIRNFKQEASEPLHCSWERFMESLFNCPEHKLNEHEQLRIFYQGLDAETRCKVRNPMEGRISNLEETLNSFIKESLRRQKESENMVWGIKKNYDQTFKAQASSIKKIESNLGKIAKIIQDREAGSLPSATETNPRGLAHAITTRSGLNYKPPKNPLENDTNSPDKPVTNETITRDEVKESDDQRKILSINIPFIDALEQMPKYAKFMKDLLAKKGRLGLGELKPTRMCIELANKSTQYPKGIAENVIGRPFLATTHAMTDVFNKKTSIEVGNKTVTFYIEKSMKFSTVEDDTCLSIDMVDLTILDHAQEIHPLDPLDSFLFEPIMNYQQSKEPNNFIKPTLFAASTKEAEAQIPKLKELPSHLEYFQISLALEDQEKTTFTCTYETFAYRRMPFGLCNAPTTFQRCMPTIFHDMCKDFMDVFMDGFSIFGNSFNSCLTNLSKMLARCKEVNLVLNWETCHFMVKEGIVLGHKISKSCIEVDKAKAFNILKNKLTPAPVIVAPDWNLNFELMCDASDYAVGAILGHRIDKKFCPIYYASKTINDAQEHYTTTKKELLAVDKKGTKNLAANHLSRLENLKLEKLNEEAIHDSFPDEHLMAIHVREYINDPWYVDYANFLVSKIIPQGLTYHLRKNFLSDIKHYIWDDPYLFKSYPDEIIRRCVFGKGLQEILEHCHIRPAGGHYGADITARNVFESGLYWPTIFKDAARYVHD